MTQRFFTVLLMSVSYLASPCALPAKPRARNPRELPDYVVARDGKARIQIVVDSKNSIPQEQQAGKELADYLGRITGCRFDVVEEPTVAAGTPCIYVGNTAFADAAGIHCKFMSPQTGRIKTHAGSLILAGGRPLGTLLVTYFFLEQLVGCRWYTVFDEMLPSQPNLALSKMDITYSPAFKFRSIYRQGGHHAGPYGGEQEFFLRNRSVAESVGVPPNANTCHTYLQYLDPRDYFAEHPEYASFINGKYSLDASDQFCQTNPDVRRIVLDRLKEVIRKNPGKDYYEVSANDGNRGRCQCPTCLQLERKEGMTAPFMDFINYLADGIREEFPNALIRTFAYNVTSEPTKTMRYRPNVVVRNCQTGAEHLPITAPENASTLQALRAWRERSTHLFKWDYDGLAHGQVFPAPILDAYVDRFRLYPKLNVEGVFLESELMVSPRPFAEMRHWVWLHLAEDPSRDVWNLVEDFCKGMYGKAAPHIVALIRLTESRKRDYPYQLYDFAYLTKAQELMTRAEQAVANDPKALARVKEAHFNIDLATLWYWTKACNDYVRMGGKETDWKFDRATLLARVEPFLAEFQKHEGRWLRCAYPKWTDEMKARVEKKWLDYFQTTVVKPVLTAGRAAKNVMPVPEEIAGIPPDRIIDLPAPVIGFCDGRGPFFEQEDDRLPVTDADAASGVAIFISEERTKPFGGTIPFVMGVYDFTGRVGGGARINRDQVKGPGYHLYRLGTFRVNETAYIYLTGSWQIQIRPLIPFLNPRSEFSIFDIYVSFKTSGPNLPFGDEGGKDGVYLDRLILVGDR